MQTINHEKLKQKLDNNENFIFLNVLSREDFKKEHIPGSENIPHNSDNFEDKVEQKAGSNDAVYCASKDCLASENAAKNLEDAGFTNVTDFEGGMKAWKDAGYNAESQKHAA